MTAQILPQAGTGHATTTLADFGAGLSVSDLPHDVVEDARLHLLDTLGCGLAALGLGEGSYLVDGFNADGASGPASVIGIERRLSAVDAALVNGTLFHAVDFDDTHPDSVVHVSAVVVAAALAAVQAAGSTSADLLAALVVGNEVSARIGAAAGGRFHARGFHPTGVCGVFGAAAAASRAAGLDAATTTEALGVAASFASGLLEFLADGSDTKRVHAGWAAQAGVQAARLAAMGLTGPRTALEGRRGFYAAYLGGEAHTLTAQLATLGHTWETLSLACKPYPACHYTHAPVDALARVMHEQCLSVGDIDTITAYTDQTGVAMVLEPAVDKARPRTPYDAKFSLPYCLAAQAVHGRLDVASFVPDAIADEAVAAMASRVTYEVRTYSAAPDAFAGGVSVDTRDGRRFTHELRHQRGAKENPLTQDDVLAKYRANAGLVLGNAEVAELESAVAALTAKSSLAFIEILGLARR